MNTASEVKRESDVATATGIARPPGPVDSPAAWRAAELHDGADWTVQFTDEQLAAVDEGLQRIARDGLELFRFDRSHITLPALDSLSVQLARRLDHGRGLVLLRGLPVDRYTDDQLYLLYWLLAVHLGQPIAQNARGELIGEVRDRGLDYGANNVRGYNTSAELKPHCDPADVVGLLCVNPALSGGESRVVSAISIFNTIAEENPELIDSLLAGFHFDLRGEGATGDPDEVTFHRVPVFSWHAGLMSCRFNEKTLTDGMRKAGVPMTELDQRAVRRVAELACDERFVLPMQFQRGDIQWLCNHSILHARSGFEDHPVPDKRRRLLRVWLNLRDGRALDDRFANRFNTGPRCGIHQQDGAGYWVKG